jgi:molecular chaperone DnaK (HSP70)
VQKKTSTKL